MNRITQAALFVAMTIPATALAAAPKDYDIAFTQVHDGDNAGLGRPNQNNDQRGAGGEHFSIASIPNAPGGARLVFCGTASYTDIPNSPVAHRIQVLCGAYQLDPMTGLKDGDLSTPNVMEPEWIKYVTNNDGDEYQNGHKLKVVPVLGGTAFAAFYGFDPDNNTDTWAQVYGADGTMLVGQTKIIENNNDDLGGSLDKFVLEADSSDTSVLVGGVIGNGNGDDDSWAFGVRIEKSAEGYTMRRTWKQNVILAEERSRAAIVPTNMPGRVLYCGTAGDSQPPKLGVLCALLNTEEGNVGNRVVWKKFVAEREGNLYKTTGDVVPTYDASGNLTDKYIVQWVQVDTSQRNGREKGMTKIFQAPIQISDTTLTMLSTPTDKAVNFGDQAHPILAGGNYGEGASAGPATFLIQGSLVDSPAGAGSISVMRFNPATNALEKETSITLPVATGMGMISQKFGNNPNTPQGRNHQNLITIKNPGFGVVGGFNPEVKELIVMPNTGPTRRLDNTLSDKAGLSLVLIPSVSQTAASGEPPLPPVAPPEPTEPEDPSSSGNASGGCNTSGSPAAGMIFALGAAVAILRRRRAA